MTMSAFEARSEAVLVGLSRGWIETRHALTDTTSVIWYFAFPVIFAIVLVFMRGKTVPGTEFALVAMALPSLVVMSFAFGGLMGPAGAIAVDREDGTLLRAKATPNGMIGYVVGKIVLFALTTLVSVVLLNTPALTVAGELLLGPRTTSWPPNLMASPKSLRGFCVTWSCFVVIPAMDARDRVFMESMTC
jgi:ABC-2 type transport system permease protein